MGQFNQTSGDYTIKTGEGNQIKFDTGAGIGEVRVTGNLVVEGDTLTVSAENLNVNDNIIILNYGETQAGVSLRYSGIQVDRGVGSVSNSGADGPASIVYDENDDSWNFAHGSPESIWNYASSKIRTKEILTNADTDGGDLTLIGYGSGVVKVTGATNYHLQVTENDHIPNKKYVDDAIQLSPTYQIKSPDGAGDNSGDSRVIIADKDVTPNDAAQPGSLAAFEDQTAYSTFGESAISVLVDGILNTQYYSNRVVMQGLEYTGNEITNNDTNANVFIRTQGTGRLQTNYALELEQIAVTPAYVSGATVVHARTPDLGGSGLFFVGSTGVNDELISKNKAVLYSMIF
jgi:hypothetical protein